MDVKHLAYMHLLLFRCKRCKEGLAISMISEERNLEGIDGQNFEVKCKCGCAKTLLGVEAVGHWVSPWDDGQDVQDLDAHMQSPMMADCATLHKFPEGSADCDYDVFEELGDGTTVWRACVVGMENVELKLRELARESESNNKFFALNFQGGIQPGVCPLKSFAGLGSYRAS